MSHSGRARSSNPRVAPHLLRRLRAVHDGLARDLGPAFSALLRTPCTVAVARLEEATYGQLLADIESPACFYLLKAEPFNAERTKTVPNGQNGLEGVSHTSELSPLTSERLMLDIEPALLHSMIDRLLGGSGVEPAPGRPMTEIELSVATRVVRRFLERCAGAWKGSLDLNPEVLQAESNPRLLRVLPADETLFIISFEVDIGDVRGLMRLCLPTRTIERVADRLRVDGPRPATPAADGTLEVAVTLAKTPISERELDDLRVGDIIMTETPATSPAVVSLADIETYRGKPGLYQGRKAVVILEELGGPPAAERP